MMKNLIKISIVFLVVSFSLHSQTISVTGSLTASRFPVKNASITFIDNADTTNKFTTVSDGSGHYNLSLTVTSVNENNTLPKKFKLEQNYPNPFSSVTNIPYGLKKASDVQVTIYDILGRVVRKFNVGWQSGGVHNILWDGRNNIEQKVAPGVYFYRLKVDGESKVRKMVFDQNGNGSFLLPHTYSFNGNASLAKVNNARSISGTTFTIRIQNTSTTIPVVAPKEFENVSIQSDTTINFSLTYIPVATVDADSLHQIIRGYGAANVVLWRPDMTDAEIQTAFGTGPGQLGFSILRIMLEPDSTRWSLSVPAAKKAHDMGAIIIASPWYAPSNMSETVGSISRVRHDMYAQYAAHINAFITYMKNHGVPIYGVSVQNEPDIEENWTSWTSSEMLTFMKDYAGLIKGAKVMDPESFHFDRTYSDPILNDSAACANTDIIAGHIYGGGLSQYPLAEEKGKEVWMTEHLTESAHSGDDWTLAMDVATEMQNVMKADMSAYVWWYIVRYYGPIGDGEMRTPSGVVTKRGYIMSQFSRFIRPGYHRVESGVYPFLSNISVTAYKDSSSSKVVIVAVNPGSTQAECSFRIQNFAGATSFTSYTTSATKNVEQGNNINVTDGSFDFYMEPSSITTFVSQ